MDYQAFLPEPPNLRVNDALISPKTVWLEIVSIASTCLCPNCGYTAARVHSRYQRVLKDKNAEVPFFPAVDSGRLTA